MYESAYLPYAGSSGWSGSATSKERADRDDASGVTSRRQQFALGIVSEAGARGVTVAELRALGLHHGQASGVLSVLHMGERIARLTERRDRCAVYVTPEYVNGRETAQQGRKKKTCPCPECPGGHDVG